MERYEDKQVENYIEQEDWYIDEEKKNHRKALPYIIGGLVLLLLLLSLGIYWRGRSKQSAKIVTFDPSGQAPIVVQIPPPLTESTKEEPIPEVFLEVKEALYSYDEKRPIPPNPFSALVRPKVEEYEQEEYTAPVFAPELGEGEEINKGTGTVHNIVPPIIEEKPIRKYPHFDLKGIAGNQTKRVAVLQVGAASKIVVRGDIVDNWRVDNIFNNGILVTDIMDGFECELVLGGEG